MVQSNFRENAERAQAEADAASLDNVRDRCLRSAAAWLAMAEREDRTSKARSENAKTLQPAGASEA